MNSNGNSDLGKVNSTEDKGQKNLNGVRTKVKGATHDLGDNIEKAGRKLQDKGFKKSGQFVENLGNKIEHSGD